ncbi:MAG TPA: cytochrome c4 [Psychromonas hadalis]|nr:cytochrome c4 [Psychromonas hadalis]
MNKLLIAAITILCFSSFTHAKGDPEAGKEKSATCTACHGVDGNSPSDLYPKIAGQHASYLEKQIKEFKTGVRNDPIMLGMTAMLSDQDIADLTAYYSQQPETQETTAPEIAEPGQKLYMGGDIKRGILACTACHGPRGMGLELAKFPKISSQHPAYIKLQLEKFRTKARNNDTNSMMTDVAAKLTDADIELLAKYISALH